MKDKKAIDILREARSLILKGWSKGSFARTKRGREVDILDIEAAKFCAMGAICRVVQKSCSYAPLVGEESIAVTMLQKAIPRHCVRLRRLGSISRFNDEKDKSRVLKLFADAIEQG